MITITGTNFLPSSLLSCRIGSSIMLSAVYVNSTAIQCMTPPSLLGAGSVEVSVSNNGEDYSDTFALFEYVNDTRVTSIHPISGSVSGGTVVTIRGYGFEDNTHYECQFGENHKVNTSFVSGNEMLCVTTSSNVAGAIDFNLLSSRDDDEIFSETFEFLHDPLIFSIGESDIFLPYNGTIQVHGAYFQKTISSICCFDQICIPSLWYSPSLIACPVPNLEPGKYSVRVSNDDFKFAVSGVKLTVYPQNDVEFISPVYGQMGSQVFVHGTNMQKNVPFECSFGGVLSRAIFLNSSSIKCIVPPLHRNEQISFELLVNGVQSKHRFNFTYDSSHIALSSVSPHTGFKNRRNEVQLKIDGIAAEKITHCMFDDHVVGILGFDVIDQSKVSCLTPLINRTGEVVVRVSTDGLHFPQSGNVLRIVDEPVFVGFTPSLGPESGGTVISIEGHGFIEGIDVTCEFKGDEKYGIQAHWVSPNLIQCTTPPMKPDRYSVGLSFVNGVDIHLPFLFFVHPYMTITSLTPDKIQGRKGNVVKLFGTNFVYSPSLACRIESDIFPASFIHSNEIRCYVTSLKSGHFVIGVSNNGQDFFTANRRLVVNNELYDDTEFSTTLRPRKLSLFDLYPTQSFTKVTTTVTLVASGIVDSPELCCFINNESVRARFVSGHELRCMLRDKVFLVGIYNVSVSNSCSSKDISNPLQLTFVSDYQIDLVRPDKYPISSGVAMNIIGRNFISSQIFTCSFGSVLVNARYVDGSLIQCIVPPLHRNEQISFELLVNGVQSKHRFNFTYDSSHIALSSVSPHTGFKNRRNEVQLKIDGIAAEKITHCMFDDHVVGILGFDVIDQSKVSCLTPLINRTGEVVVRVSTDGLHFPQSGNVLRIVDEPVFVGFTPSLGPESGGTVISIEGHGFIEGIDVTCEFKGDEKYGIQAHWVSPNLIQCTTPQMTTGVKKVTFVQNKINKKAILISTFSVYRDVTLSSITPKAGSVNGETRIHVYGTNFFQSPDALCTFGKNGRSKATILNETTLTCVVPAFPMAQMESLEFVMLKVSLNGIDRTMDSVPFALLPLRAFDYLSPQSGPSSGGTVITISGNYFLVENFTHPLCRIGSIEFEGIAISNETLYCMTPPQQGENKSERLQISLNGGVNWLNSLNDSFFTYIENNKVLMIYPRSGTVRGGTLVSVYGENFKKSRYLSCMFGGINATNIYWYSSSRIACESPPSLPGKVHIRVSSNGVDFDRDNILFNYVSPEYIENIEPNHGSRFGGTLINVNGANFLFSQDIFCRFGSVTSKAMFVSNRQIQCKTPAQKVLNETNIPLSIVFDSNEERNENFFFRYQDPPSFLSLRPKFVYTSSTSKIVINTTYEINEKTNVWCRFRNSNMESVIVQSTFGDENPLCEAPIFDFETKVYVDISTNKQEWSLEIPLTYINSPTVVSLSPPFGSMDGKTEVAIGGVGFARNVKYMCLFGQSLTPAHWKSSKILHCSTPPSSAPIMTNFSLALDKFSALPTPLTFEFIPSMSLSRLNPESGSSRGGQTIILEGSNFIHSTDLFCSFGNKSVPALFHSENIVSCSSPQHQSGPVEVTISCGDSKSSSQQFQYLPEISLTKIVPELGPIGGGTSIEVHGLGFEKWKEYNCKFGEKEVEAIYIDPYLLSCLSPPYLIPGIITLEVISDYDITLQEVTFRYTPSPFIDHIVPSSVMLGNNQYPIFVSGGNFLDNGGLKCIYGDDISIVTAKWLSSSLIECPFDLQQFSGSTKLAISNNWGHDKTAMLDLDIRSNQTTVNAFPHSGVSSGDTLVTLHIEGFFNVLAPKCIFGEMRVTAIQTSLAEFRCYSPPNKAEEVSLKFSSDRMSVLDLGVYKYYDDPIIRSIFPTFGPLAGGTPISVHGYSLNHVKYCYFESDYWIDKILVSLLLH